MPIVQIDWQSIKEKFGDVTAIYALTHRQASLLLSLSEQLSWEKTFREFGYDFSDKDALDWDIDDLRNNLVSPVDLVDIIQYIDDVESLLQIIADNMANEPGCCPDGVQYYPTTPIPGFDTVPQPIVDAGYADDVNDLEGYFDYRCMAGHLFLSNVQEKLDRLGPIITGGFLLFNILAGLFTFLTAGIGTAVVVTIAGLAIEASTIITLINSLKDVSSLLPPQWADDLEDCRDNIICAMLFADGAEAVRDAFLEQVEACLGEIPAVVIANLNLDPMIEALWYGQQNGIDVAQIMADNDINPGDFTCCQTETGQLVPHSDFSFGLTGWDNVVGEFDWLSSYNGEMGVARHNVLEGVAMHDLESSYFTIPDGADLTIEARWFHVLDKDQTFLAQIFRVSDNALMGTYSTGRLNDGIGAWRTSHNVTPINIADGTQCYISFSMDYHGAPTYAYISYLKVFYET